MRILFFIIILVLTTTACKEGDIVETSPTTVAATQDLSSILSRLDAIEARLDITTTTTTSTPSEIPSINTTLKDLQNQLTNTLDLATENASLATSLTTQLADVANDLSSAQLDVVDLTSQMSSITESVSALTGTSVLAISNNRVVVNTSNNNGVVSDQIEFEPEQISAGDYVQIHLDLELIISSVNPSGCVVELAMGQNGTDSDPRIVNAGFSYANSEGLSKNDSITIVVQEGVDFDISDTVYISVISTAASVNDHCVSTQLVATRL